MKTPLDVTKEALHQYALSAPDTQEMAMAADALRLMNEREKEACFLFAEGSDNEPATSKQYRYLRNLGYRGKVHSKGHAATLIQQWLEKQQTKKERRHEHEGDTQVGGRTAER